MKKNILEDKKWHCYAWVYDRGKAILYVDGKIYKGKSNMTIDYWFRGGLKSRKETLGDILKSKLDEFRISKCARRKKWTGLKRSNHKQRRKHGRKQGLGRPGTNREHTSRYDKAGSNRRSGSGKT